MLKVSCDCGKVEVDFTGDVGIAVADLAYIVRSVWEMFNTEEERDNFRKMFTETVNEDVFRSDEEIMEYFKDNLDDVVEKLKYADKEMRKKLLDGFGDVLIAEIIGKVLE